MSPDITLTWTTITIMLAIENCLNSAPTHSHESPSRAQRVSPDPDSTGSRHAGPGNDFSNGTTADRIERSRSNIRTMGLIHATSPRINRAVERLGNGDGETQRGSARHATTEDNETRKPSGDAGNLVDIDQRGGDGGAAGRGRGFELFIGAARHG